jgi:hypothetical protein
MWKAALEWGREDNLRWNRIVGGWTRTRSRSNAVTYHFRVNSACVGGYTINMRLFIGYGIPVKFSDFTSMQVCYQYISYPALLTGASVLPSLLFVNAAKLAMRQVCVFVIMRYQSFRTGRSAKNIY